MFVACQKKSNLAYYRVYKNHASSDEHTGEKQKRKDILHTKDTINTVNSFFPPYTKAFETRMGFICVEIQV